MKSSFVLIMFFVLASAALSAQDADSTRYKFILSSGVSHKGYIIQEDTTNFLVATYFGSKLLPKSEVIMIQEVVEVTSSRPGLGVLSYGSAPIRKGAVYAEAHSGYLVNYFAGNLAIGITKNISLYSHINANYFFNEVPWFAENEFPFYIAPKISLGSFSSFNFAGGALIGRDLANPEFKTRMGYFSATLGSSENSLTATFAYGRNGWMAERDKFTVNLYGTVRLGQKWMFIADYNQLRLHQQLHLRGYLVFRSILENVWYDFGVLVLSRNNFTAISSVLPVLGISIPILKGKDTH